MSELKTERFQVLTVDEDGTVELQSLDEKRKSNLSTIWTIAEGDLDLAIGAIVEGSIVDKQDSPGFRFPRFILANN